MLYALVALSIVLQIVIVAMLALKKERGIVEKLEARDRLLLDDASRSRQEASQAARQAREELSLAVRGVGESLLAQVEQMDGAQLGQLRLFSDRLDGLTERTEEKLDLLRAAIDERLRAIQDDNGKQLDKMRATVDEKLQGTLERRLGESFRLVSDRLEQVHKGLGEMQTLAIGVGDLKRVLTNVKTRGGWGEVQLGALLEQVLTPEQYARNVKTKEGSDALVEFAIRMPGQGETVWLPVDAKFPTEDYQRLVLAQEAADLSGVDEASRALALRIRGCAKDIATKYVSPPSTTDFAILFLPTEGLYAEVVRNVDLVESVQREHRVVIAGPSILAALLNSLQMGFRTLAVQQRSSEVWKLLGVVKHEFVKFGDVLDSVRKKLDQAAKTMDSASQRSRQIQRKLNAVEATDAPLLEDPEANLDALDE